MATRPGRQPWAGSNRKQRLPANWDTELRPAAHERNPEHVCHWCGLPGGSDLDHKVAGDDHSLDNLDWIHGRTDFLEGRSTQNCHGAKSGREGAIAAAAAMRRQRRPEEPHPAFS
jgi:5-methylcytosine-specific restriction protein A